MAKDVKMQYLESDIRKIQVKTNMYLQSYGEDGVFHLFKEVAQNGLDEISDTESDGRILKIVIDELEDSVFVEDDGRGFPEADFPLEIFCTTLQSGSKFKRESGGKSAGEFGIGLTACNALSEYFSIKSYREKENYIHTIVFNEGVKIEDKKESLKGSKKKHGCEIKFIPSKKFLGPSAKVPYDKIVTWLEDRQYDMEKGMVVTLEKRKGLKVIESKKFTAKDDIGLIDRICSDKFIIKPFKLERHDTFEETITDTVENPKYDKNNPKSEPYILKHRKVKRIVDYSVIIAFDDNIDCIFNSYCNFTNTIDGGVHLDAATNAVFRYLHKRAKAALSDKEKDKIDILWNDIRSNMKMVVKLSTDASVEFIGNAKQKIGSEELGPIMVAGITEELVKYLEKDHPETGKNIDKLIKLNAKARIEANKARTATVKNNLTRFDEHEMKNYSPCNSKGKNDYRELYIVEGDSAKGSANGGRYPSFQAVYAVRGVTANPFKQSLAELMNEKTGNQELIKLVKILRCGIGNNFNINNLYFDKIIIMTDADIDGHGITASIAAFFLLYMPELVLAGKIYKVLPPLYALRSGNNRYFARNKEDKLKFWKKDVIKHYSVKLPVIGKEPLSKSEFNMFLDDTDSYQDNLSRITNHFKVNKFLIERIAAFMVFIQDGKIDYDYDPADFLSDQRKITTLMDALQQEFPEVKLVSDDTIRGVVEGRYQSLSINKRFIRRISVLFETFNKYGYSAAVMESGESKYRRISIGRFLDESLKYAPTIETRFKGLGEMTPDSLRETTLNPNTRILVRFVCHDIKRALKQFEMMFGTKQADLAGRKVMMSNYQIKHDDLDN